MCRFPKNKLPNEFSERKKEDNLPKLQQILGYPKAWTGA